VLRKAVDRTTSALMEMDDSLGSSAPSCTASWGLSAGVRGGTAEPDPFDPRPRLLQEPRAAGRDVHLAQPARSARRSPSTRSSSTFTPTSSIAAVSGGSQAAVTGRPRRLAPPSAAADR
jgi:hypothetical protein